MTGAICQQCGEPLQAASRRHARFCSPAHRSAYHRSSTVGTRPRVPFLTGATCDKSAAIVLDKRVPGMYRLKRADGSLSDMVNLTRAKDALGAMRGEP
jgi:hypothetical protein